MKKFLIPLAVVLYIADVLFIVIGCIPEESASDAPVTIWLILISLGLVFALLNIIFSAVLSGKREYDAYVSARRAFVFKLIFIPHYIFAFVFFIILIIGGFASILTVFFVAAIPILLIAFLLWAYTYFIMVSTGVDLIFSLWKNRESLGTLRMIAVAVCQFFFIADIISAAYIMSYAKEQTPRRI